MRKYKKGQAITLQNLAMIGVTIFVLAIVLGFGAKINYKIADTMLTGETVRNETLTTLTNTTNETIDCMAHAHSIFSTSSLRVTFISRFSMILFTS